MELEDLLRDVGGESEKESGVKYAIDYIKDRQQLDRLSNLSKEEMYTILKFYTIAEIFNENEDDKLKYHRIIDKFLGLATSKMGFGFTKIVDIFKSDIEYNPDFLKNRDNLPR